MANLILIPLLFLLFLKLMTCSDFNTCGKSKSYSGLISGGNETKKGEFPFLAALYDLEIAQVFCGGSLITTRDVITGKLFTAKKKKEKLRAFSVILHRKSFAIKNTFYGKFP